MIIFRYLAREILIAIAGITGILLLIFLSNQFVRYLSAIAVGKLSAWVMLRLLLLQIPHLLGLLLPLGLFLGILLAYGRLYTDNEMTILQANGISPNRLLQIALSVTLAIAFIVACFNLWLGPMLAKHQEKLLAQANAASFVQNLQPGRFVILKHGRLIIYVEKMSVNHKRMDNVFVAEQANRDDFNDWHVTNAKSGYQTLDPNSKALYFVTNNGHRYEGEAGAKDFRIMEYQRYGVKVHDNPGHINLLAEDILPTLVLWELAKSQTHYEAELQWRIAMPLSVIILGMLAVPLSKVKPRQSKYAQLIPAILLYIVYVNLLLIAKAWVESASLSPILGLWCIHVAMLIVALLFLKGPSLWTYLKHQYFRMRGDESA